MNNGNKLNIDLPSTGMALYSDMDKKPKRLSSYSVESSRSRGMGSTLNVILNEPVIPITKNPSTKRVSKEIVKIPTATSEIREDQSFSPHKMSRTNLAKSQLSDKDDMSVTVSVNNVNSKIIDRRASIGSHIEAI